MTKTQNEETINRTYKDTVFRMVFKEKKELLSLFNAINGTHYENPDDLTINTLENAIYMSFKNDISCILDMRMELYEHQSTVNPNMPLRDLLYVASLYEKFIVTEDIYSGTRIPLPTPKFVVFYNGKTAQPERKILKLSDSYTTSTGETNLELIVLQLNINYGFNQELADNCKTLSDYMLFTHKVRFYQEQLPFHEAVERAIDECIKEGILAEFLKQNRAEVVRVSIFEYDRELHERKLGEDRYQKGLEAGIAEGERRGKEQGISIGKQQGIAEGEQLATQEIIKNMLSSGHSPEFIAESTGKPLELILEIQKEI